MPRKMSIMVPLTARQQAQIKRATGRTVSTLKVGPSGALVASKRLVAAKRFTAAKRMVAPRRFRILES